MDRSKEKKNKLNQEPKLSFDSALKQKVRKKNNNKFIINS
jgi:hypothetical protein